MAEISAMYWDEFILELVEAMEIVRAQWQA